MEIKFADLCDNDGPRHYFPRWLELRALVEDGPKPTATDWGTRERLVGQGLASVEGRFHVVTAAGRAAYRNIRRELEA